MTFSDCFRLPIFVFSLFLSFVCYSLKSACPLANWRCHFIQLSVNLSFTIIHHKSICRRKSGTQAAKHFFHLQFWCFLFPLLLHVAHFIKICFLKMLLWYIAFGSHLTVISTKSISIDRSFPFSMISFDFVCCQSSTAATLTLFLQFRCCFYSSLFISTHSKAIYDVSECDVFWFLLNTAATHNRHINLTIYGLNAEFKHEKARRKDSHAHESWQSVQFGFIFHSFHSPFISFFDVVFCCASSWSSFVNLTLNLIYIPWRSDVPIRNLGLWIYIFIMNLRIWHDNTWYVGLIEKWLLRKCGVKTDNSNGKIGFYISLVSKQQNSRDTTELYMIINHKITFYF